MNIEELLNKYFDGDTTCEEERELCRFFTQETVPEHLKEYSPLFAFLDKENKQAKEACTDHSSLTVSSRKTVFRRRLIYCMSGIAAGLLLLLGIAGIHRHFNAMPDSYVIIDGKCYTDENLVREQAMTAFRNVSLDEDELLNSLFDGE
ncbi:hypothetical protein GPL06_11110 [Bacteroides salyersiae]|uniref:hypothetical protein n=1 Tax=Bacteroides salyersiae TaxID=291644 RepID=UPI001C02B67E|nr:hypothetical protein [Bacteroides salyersiae]MBT9873350.1 hypothetical protein [Bacteroides salyersiae]MCS2403722.1 hypothetical protein [Bacteroides salyersiae]